MNDIVSCVIGLAIVVMLLGGGVFIGYSLIKKQRKLQLDLAELLRLLDRSQTDVAGLCSAAVAVDKRLALLESELGNLIGVVSMRDSEVTKANEPMDEIDEAGAAEQGYRLAIERIHDGADAEELVKHCGLTRDEAMLLLRLHGRNRV